MFGGRGPYTPGGMQTRGRQPIQEIESDSESDGEEEPLWTRITTNASAAATSAYDWAGWGNKKFKKVLYEVSCHGFFIAIPVFITLLMQQMDEAKWQQTLQVAQKEYWKNK